MIATSGAAGSLLGRHSTAPAARTALPAGTETGETSSFGTSTPADHSDPLAGQSHGTDLTDAGGVPSTRLDGRAPCVPPAVMQSIYRRHPIPSTGWRDPSRIRRRHSVER